MAACKTASHDPEGTFTCEAAEAIGEGGEEEAGEEPVEAPEGVEAGEEVKETGSSSWCAGGRRIEAETKTEEVSVLL